MLLRRMGESVKRAIVIVLDGCGAGAAPDATQFGDADNPSTIKNVWDHCGGLTAPTLEGIGFFAACGIETPVGLDGFKVEYGRLQEMSQGKDSVTGHWEMMGVHTSVAFPTYPNGFPLDLVQAFEAEIGRKVIGNKPASGTAIITELGAEHIETGSPILYTSADSVFQIAAHEEHVPLETLYDWCRIARRLCQAPNNVQRVIARPFVGDAVAGFKRTENRKDFPLPAPKNDVDLIGDVFGIGVIPELFDGRGFRPVRRTQSNPEHAKMLAEALSSDAQFIFANFEDFDMLFGHRNDPSGFGKCLEEFDQTLAGILSQLSNDDLLIVTADHGNDPTSGSTDHSREYVPCCVVSRGDGVIHQPDLQGMWHVGTLVKNWLRIGAQELS